MNIDELPEVILLPGKKKLLRKDVPKYYRSEGEKMNGDPGLFEDPRGFWRDVDKIPSNKEFYDPINDMHFSVNINDALAESEKVKGEKTKMNSSQEKIENVLENMKDLLLYKNEKYGDSILSKEGQVFFKGDPKVRVAMHLDEKLSRIRNNPDGEPRKNDIMDLIGYLVFELIALGATREDFEKEMD